MYAFLSLLSFTVAILLAGGKALLARRPGAPAWIRASLTTVIVRFATAVFLVLGLVLIIAFDISHVGTRLTPSDVELIGGMFIVFTIVLAVMARVFWWGWESPRVTGRKRFIGQH